MSPVGADAPSAVSPAAATSGATLTPAAPAPGSAPPPHRAGPPPPPQLPGRRWVGPPPSLRRTYKERPELDCLGPAAPPGRASAADAKKQAAEDTTSNACCLAHGDAAPLSRDLQRLLSLVQVALTADGQPEGIPVPPSCLAYTAFWAPLLASGATPAHNLLRYSAAQVCRQHQRAVCVAGRGCLKLHVCRQFWAAAAPRPPVTPAPAMSRPLPVARVVPPPVPEEAASSTNPATPVSPMPGPRPSVLDAMRVLQPTVPDSLPTPTVTVHFAEPAGLLRPVSADSSESSHTPDDPADIFSRGLSLEAYHHLVHALQPAPKPHSTA